MYFLSASSAETGVVLPGDLVRAAISSFLFPPQTRGSERPRVKAEDDWQKMLDEVATWVEKMGAATAREPKQTEKRPLYG